MIAIDEVQGLTMRPVVEREREREREAGGFYRNEARLLGRGTLGIAKQDSSKASTLSYLS